MNRIGLSVIPFNAALIFGASGANWSSTITIPSSPIDTPMLPPEELEPLLRHEYAHVRQIERRGVVRFYVRYAVEYAMNRLRGMRHDTAYRAISFEREAFAAEAGGVESYESTPPR